MRMCPRRGSKCSTSEGAPTALSGRSRLPALRATSQISQSCDRKSLAHLRVLQDLFPPQVRYSPARRKATRRSRFAGRAAKMIPKRASKSLVLGVLLVSTLRSSLPNPGRTTETKENGKRKCRNRSRGKNPPTPCAQG